MVASPAPQASSQRPAPAGKSLGAWYQSHKVEAWAGGGVAAVAVALYMRSKSSASTTSSTAASTGTSTDPATYDPGSFSGFSGWEPSQPAATSTSTPTGAAATVYQQFVRVGQIGHGIGVKVLNAHPGKIFMRSGNAYVRVTGQTVGHIREGTPLYLEETTNG